MVVEGQISLKEASVRLKIGYRQAKRVLSRYRRQGEAGLLHGLLGRVSNSRTDPGLMERVLRAYRQSYTGFGPTLACEKLKEREGIRISVETLRQMLIKEGLWQRKKRPRGYHARRQ